MVRGQCKFINEYLLEYPAERPAVLADIRARDLQSIVYRRLNQDLAHTLVLADVAPPTVHPQAVELAERVRDGGAVVDVVCAAHINGARQNSTLRAIWRPSVESILRVEARAPHGSWAWANAFYAQGAQFIAAQFEAKGRPYDVVYSTANSPATALLAAWYKLTHPQSRWVAEFPAAASEITSAADRPDPALLRRFADCLDAAGFVPPEQQSSWAWARQLCCALADEIRVTDEPQVRSYLAVEDARLSARAASRLASPRP
jgi:hypothetical protein